MEEICFEKETFKIPSNISENFSTLLDIISPDTWNNVLTDEHRQHLMTFLPDFPENDLHEKTQTLEMFFMNENFFFGSPLTKFFIDLKNENFQRNVCHFKRINKKLQCKSYRYSQKQYYSNLLEEVLIKRKKLICGVQSNGVIPKPFANRKQHNKVHWKETCLQRARKRYFREIKAIKTEANCGSDYSDDENYPEGSGFSLNKKQRRQLLLLETSFPSNLSVVLGTYTRGSLALDLEAHLTSEDNPFDSSDEHMKSLLAQHVIRLKKKKKTLRTDTRGTNLQGVLDRAQSFSKKPLPKPFALIHAPSSPKSVLTPSLKKVVKKRIVPIAKEKLSYNFSVPKFMKKEFPVKKVPPLSVLSRPISSEDSSSDFDMFETVKVEPEIKVIDQQRTLLAPELTQETHSSFFSLLRDVICSTQQQRMNRLQLETNISTWQDSAISPLNEWFCQSESWVKALPSAINFLCGNVRISSVDKLPIDYVPFVEHKSTTKNFQWIGAGRDSDSNLEMLSRFWLSNRDDYCNDWPTPEKASSEAPTTTSAPSIMQSLPAINPDSSTSNQYHVQERMRYTNPHKAYTYRMNGYESVIGPVKGVYSQQVNTTSRARDHTLLVSNRPPYVTILSLVWDAVARLPSGEGTKSDICKLLKHSQFIVPVTNPTLENNLTSVVSGALDRLQNEKDPCVKFDTPKKLWVYLHCNRTEREFERIHHLKGPLGGGKGKRESSKSKKAKKEEAAKGPPNVSMEQFSSAIKHMDGSEVKVKDEDLLKNWVKISTAPMKKKETVKITSSQLRADLAKMKAANAKAAADSMDLLTKQGFKPVTKLSSSLGTENKSGTTTVGISTSPLTSESTAPTVCSTFQFSKKGKAVLQTTTSATAIAISSPKSTLKAQGSRKYHSVMEKKKLLKAMLSSSHPLTSAEEKLSSPSPTFVTAGTKTVKPAVTDAATVSGIKVLQYSNPNMQGKTSASGTLSVEGNSGIPATLVGQKLVVAGNRVLVHNGKILHNLAGTISGARGKQMIAGIPAQHIMALNRPTIRKAGSEGINVEGGSRFLQIASMDGSSSSNSTPFQKVNLVSQLGQQKTLELQKSGTQSGEFKLKFGGNLPSNITGNLISLGGKQIFLTKGHAAKRTPGQLHQVVMGEQKSAGVSAESRNVGQISQLSGTRDQGSGQQPLLLSASSTLQTSPPSISAQPILKPAPKLTTGTQSLTQKQQITTANQFVMTTNASGQQIVVPSSQLKRLQAFQSFKVVSTSSQQIKGGKPMVAHILAPSTSTAGKVSFQITSDKTTKKSP